MVVLPALGGATTSARCPKPRGTNRSMRRGAIGVLPVSNVMRRLGWMGVSFSKAVRAVDNVKLPCVVAGREVGVSYSVSQKSSPSPSLQRGFLSVVWFDLVIYPYRCSQRSH